MNNRNLLVLLVSYEGERLTATKKICDKLSKLADEGAINDFAIFASPIVEFTK